MTANASLMKLKMLMVFAVLMMPRPAFAASMLCIAEKSVGFDWEQEQWVPKVFSTDSKFILRTATEKDKADPKLFNPTHLKKTQISHVWSRFGSGPSHGCASSKTTIQCDLGIGIFNFRKLSQRFVFEQGLGMLMMDQPQVHEFKKTFDLVWSSTVEIGSCSKI